MEREDRLRAMDVVQLEKASEKLREVIGQVGQDSAERPGPGWDNVLTILLDDVMAVIQEKQRRAKDGEI